MLRKRAAVNHEAQFELCMANDEKALIRRLQTGETSAFRELVENHKRTLFNLAYDLYLSDFKTRITDKKFTPCLEKFKRSPSPQLRLPHARSAFGQKNFMRNRFHFFKAVDTKVKTLYIDHSSLLH